MSRFLAQASELDEHFLREFYASHRRWMIRDSLLRWVGLEIWMSGGTWPTSWTFPC